MTKRITIPNLKLKSGEIFSPFKGFYIQEEESYLHIVCDREGNLIRLNMAAIKTKSSQKIEVASKSREYTIYEAHYLYLGRVKVNPFTGHDFEPTPCLCEGCKPYNLLFGKKIE